MNQLNLKTSVENILFTSGLQNSLAITLTSLFSYGAKLQQIRGYTQDFKNNANMLGIRLVPIPFKKNKLDLAYFEQACKLEKVKGLYILPDI
ncbi:hypothetical protein ACWY2R_07065 [Enterococcus avium]